jgi:hypothetical protein
MLHHFIVSDIIFIYMAFYTDRRTGEEMVQTSIYLPKHLRDWARDNDIKLGRMLSNNLKLEKENRDKVK